MAQSEKRIDTADKSVLLFSFCCANFWSVDVVFVKTVQNEVIVANDSSKHNSTYKQIELKLLTINSVNFNIIDEDVKFQ